VPKTSQFYWGFCIPSQCTHKELEIVLKEKIDNFLKTTEITVETQVQEKLCQTKKDLEFKLDHDTSIGM
jgi:hypothetical protein